MADLADIIRVEETSLPVLQEVLGPILNHKVTLTILSVDEGDPEKLKEIFPESPVLVDAPVGGAVSGSLMFLYSRKLAAAITDLMVMGDGSAAFDEQESLDGVSEATNQIVAALASFWSEKLESEVNPIGAKAQLFELDGSDFDFSQYHQVVYRITIDDWGEDTFVKLLPLSLGDELVQIPGDESELAGVDATSIGEEAASPLTADAGSMGGPSVSPAEFAPFDDAGTPIVGGEPRNLDLLMDISLPVTIELGRTRMLIREILAIGPGSVIELQKLSGEPVDLYVNDKKFALGEVVVIDENFGIRITELLKVEERIKALK